MADIPAFDDTMRQALSGLDNEDVKIFYAYFEDLKRHVRHHVSRKAKFMPGESAIAHSALISLFCDLALTKIPLTDVDEYGYPMLWPLLLKYLERHCDKWNKYYLTKKRQGIEISLGKSTDEGGVFEPADYRGSADDETGYAETLEALSAKLTEDEQAILQGRLRNESLQELAARINRAESTVSNRLNRIRKLLQTT